MVLLVAFVALCFAVRKARLRSAAGAVKEGRALLQDIERLGEEVEILKVESVRRRRIIDLVLAIAEALPKGIVLSGLGIDAKGGVTMQGKAPSYEAVWQAKEALGGSAEFTDVVGQASKEKQGFMFRMSCKVARGAAAGAIPKTGGERK